MSKVFFNSRASARLTGHPVKDAGVASPKGKRWYVGEDAAKPVVKPDPVLQGIFNGAAKHLLKQNAKSLVGIHCKYRGHAGKMCAIGPFIADVHYSKEIEGGTVSRGRVRNALEKSGFPVDNAQAMSLASNLQSCHDSYEIKDWPNRLRRIAGNFNLSAAVVK